MRQLANTAEKFFFVVKTPIIGKRSNILAGLSYKPLRWMKISDGVMLIYKAQADKKAEWIYSFDQWRISMSQSDTLSNESSNDSDQESQNHDVSGAPVETQSSAFIIVENLVQLGCHIAAEDKVATLDIYNQLISD